MRSRNYLMLLYVSLCPLQLFAQTESLPVTFRVAGLADMGKAGSVTIRTLENQDTISEATSVVPANTSPEKCGAIIVQAFQKARLRARVNANEVTVAVRVDGTLYDFIANFTGLSIGVPADPLNPKPETLRVTRGTKAAGGYIAVIHYPHANYANARLSVFGENPNQSAQSCAGHTREALFNAGIAARTADTLVTIDDYHSYAFNVRPYDIRFEGLEGTVQEPNIHPAPKQTSPKPTPPPSGPGMVVTFASGTVGLPGGLRVVNGKTGKEIAEHLEKDTSAEVCAVKLVNACGLAGLNAIRDGAKVTIYGVGNRVDVTTATITKTDF